MTKVAGTGTVCELRRRAKTVPKMTYNVFSGTLNPTHFTSLYVDGPGGYIRQLRVLAQMTKLRVLEQQLNHLC